MVSSVNTNYNSLYNWSQYANQQGNAGQTDDTKLLLDVDSATATLVGPDGVSRPVTPQELEKILADNGLKLEGKGKTFVTNDGFELSPSEVNASSPGGAPILPNVGGTNSGLSASGIRAVERAYNRFGDQGMQANALILQGLLAVLRSSQEDRGDNMRLTNTTHGMKNANFEVEKKSKEDMMEYRIAQAEHAVKQAWVMAAISVAAAGMSAAGAGMGSGVGDAISRAADALGSLSKAVANAILYKTQKEQTESRQEIEHREQEARIEGEVIDQTLEVVKEAASDNKDEFKKALKLLQEVAQRQNDSVRAMNV